MIELHNLTVGYGEKAILSDINQTLEPGRLVCLLGSNGVGKSTTAKTSRRSPYRKGAKPSPSC